MFRYVAFVWDPLDTPASSAAASFSQRLHVAEPAWRTSLLAPGLAVHCIGARASANEARVLHGAKGVVLGQLFHSVDQAPEARRTLALDQAETRHIVQTAGRHLVDRYWGRYVAFLHDAATRCTRVLRDPSGTLPCFRLSHRGVQLYFSWTEDALALVDLAPKVNWDYLRVHVPSIVIESNETGLDGIQQVLAGECVTIGNGSMESVLYWKPAEIAESDVIEDRTIAARTLRHTTRACVRAWAQCYEGIVLRLSGGLDSSVTLSCMQDPTVGTGVTCLNYFSTGADSDERNYARLAAARANRDLVEQERDSNIDLARLLDLAKTPKPTFYLEYLSNARVEAELAHTHSASAIFTGTGGDQLFYQIPTISVAADYVRRFGIQPELWRVGMDAARFGGASVWATLAAAVRDGFRRRISRTQTDLDASMTLVDPEVIAAARRDQRFLHPLLRAAEGLPPGKFLQLRNLVFPTEYYNPLGFADDPERVHPLLSQPLIEVCLRIPTYVLINGGRERALARQAFTADLPPEIVARRSKGGLEEHVNAVLEGNADFVRSLLLDGALVRERIVNRHRLEATLSGRLNNGGAFAAELHTYVAIEAWLYCWSAARRRAAP